jgi:hypothetical protein
MENSILKRFGSIYVKITADFCSFLSILGLDSAQKTQDIQVGFFQRFVSSIGNIEKAP